jgi:hypothetical protein
LHVISDDRQSEEDTHCTQVLFPVSHTGVEGLPVQSELWPQRPAGHTHRFDALQLWPVVQSAATRHWTQVPSRQNGAPGTQSTSPWQPTAVQVPPSPEKPGSQVQVTLPPSPGRQSAFGEQPPLFTAQGSDPFGMQLPPSETKPELQTHCEPMHVAFGSQVPQLPELGTQTPASVAV